MLSLRNTLSYQGIQTFNIKGWKKVHRADGKQKQASIVIFVSDKVNFKPIPITRDKRDVITIKGTINQVLEPLTA